MSERKEVETSQADKLPTTTDSIPIDESTTQATTKLPTPAVTTSKAKLSTTVAKDSTLKPTATPAKASTAKPTTTEQVSTTTLAEETTKAPSTTTAFPYEQCRTALNVRYPIGSLISNASVPVDDCCRLCQTEPRCQGFTYNVANRTCYLVAVVGGRSLEKGWLSGGTKGSAVFQGRGGEEGTALCLTEQHMTSFYGGNLGKHRNVSQGDCCELCYEHLHCVGYSFEKAGNASDFGDCTLKKQTRQRNPIFGERFISATLTAKRNLTSTTAPPTSGPATTEPPATKAPRAKDAPPEPQPPVLGETEQSLDVHFEVVVDTIQSIGCIWIVVAATLTLAVCAVFRNTSHERLIHVSQELSILIAHVIILAHRDPKFSDYNWTLCRVSALALHYLQTVTTAAFLLEAVQIYAVSTSVELAGGFFTRRASFVLAWALPAVLTGMTAPFIYYSYVSWFSCWINLDAVGSKVVFGPIMILVAITVITWEAASSFRGEVLASDPTQRLTALVNRQGLPVVMGLYVACHATGSMAIHYQVSQRPDAEADGAGEPAGPPRRHGPLRRLPRHRLHGHPLSGQPATRRRG